MFDKIIGESQRHKRSLDDAKRVAPTDVTVLILGETGTGKELVAQAIHESSKRNDQVMVSVNCASLPGTLIDSELFGHEKGTFTGAHARRCGRFELANGGTLFLDEIGDLPLELQGKLLRVLQEGKFERLGGTGTICTNVRVIAATNRNLQQAVDDGDFRADLYYRLNIFPIHLAPLRERREDIPLLVQHFFYKHARRLDSKVKSIATHMVYQLSQRIWPGNIRQLEGYIQRALISATGPILELTEPPEPDSLVATSTFGMSTNRITDLRAVERNYIVAIIEQSGWTIEGENGAASVLCIPPSTLRSKMKRLGINRGA